MFRYIRIYYILLVVKLGIVTMVFEPLNDDHEVVVHPGNIVGSSLNGLINSSFCSYQFFRVLFFEQLHLGINNIINTHFYTMYLPYTFN